jgi:F-type H+-transporting ATPase subunit delta
VKVVIDPTVLGGLVAQVGDTVIDGSIRSKLDQLKTAF